jgi:hypothetical protein
VLLSLLAVELREMRPPNLTHAIIALSSLGLLWCAGRILHDRTAALGVALQCLAVAGMIGGGTSLVLMTFGDSSPATQRVIGPLLSIAVGVAALAFLRWLDAKRQSRPRSA